MRDIDRAKEEKQPQNRNLIWKKLYINNTNDLRCLQSREALKRNRVYLQKTVSR